MTPKLRNLLLAGCTALVVAADPALGQIGPVDHVICHKAKDTLRGKKYKADLNGFTFQPGCVIKTPAKLI